MLKYFFCSDLDIDLDFPFASSSLSRSSSWSQSRLSSHARLHHCVFVASSHLSSDRLRIIIIRDFIFAHLSLDAFRSIASHGLSSCVQLNMRLYIIMSSRSACRAIVFARASAS